ncbi:MAG: hypothetical protein H0X50_06820 [Nitrosopumilus sp.]|nr:hypothetical protein [Nitrosopumilus sp.]
MHHYNIHDIISVSSEVDLFELEYFRHNDPSREPDMTITISKSIVPMTAMRRKILVDENPDSVNIRYTEHFGTLGSQFAVKFMGKKAEITVNKMISKSKHVLYVNLVEPILRFMLLSRGFILLHSACIADETGNGMLFSAPPDTGKTTTVLKCLKRGFSLLSDDMTILKFPNTALCFPKPMTISSHTFNTATSMSSDNNAKKSANPGLKIRSLVHSKEGRQFMRKLGTMNVPIFTINTIGQAVVRPPKFNAQDLLQKVKIRNDAKVRSLYFLEKGGEDEIPIPNTEALRKAVENSDDAFIFPPYRDMIKHIRVDGKTAIELLELEKSMLGEFFSDISLAVMRSDSRSWFERIEKMYPTPNDL